MRIHRKRCSTGFTLLELLVVLTIAGLLAAIVPPLFANAVPGARLKSTAREFTTSLRDARSRAITTSRPVVLRVIADPPSYSIDNAPANLLPSGVSLNVYDYITASREALADRDALTAEDIPIRFFADGSSTGAIFKISNSGTAYRIDVSWLTGNIHVSEVGGHDR